jgi:hypothetical protein
MTAYPKRRRLGGGKRLAGGKSLLALTAATVMVAGWPAPSTAAQPPEPYAYLPSGSKEAALAANLSWSSPGVMETLQSWYAIGKMFPKQLAALTAVPPSKPPPVGDPRNLQGIWQPTAVYPILMPIEGAGADGLAPYSPEGEKIITYALKMNTDGTPVATPLIYCRPIGPHAIILAQPTQFFQERDTLWRTYNGSFSMVDIVHLDRQHPKNLKPSYLGDAVGRWEGNTLVVDTIGYNDKTNLDHAGSPHSDKLHLVERFTKSEDGSYIDYAVSYDDPVYYTHPFSVMFKFLWRPDAKVPVLPCEENPRTVIVKEVYYNGVRPPKFKTGQSSPTTEVKP